MFDASCSFAIKVQILLFMMKCVNRKRKASVRVRTSPLHIRHSIYIFQLPEYRKLLEYRIEKPKHCSIYQRLVEGLEAVPELDNETTFKILFGLALASHQSIYFLSQRIEMLGGYNSSSCPCDPQG